MATQYDVDGPSCGIDTPTSSVTDGHQQYFTLTNIDNPQPASNDVAGERITDDRAEQYLTQLIENIQQKTLLDERLMEQSGEQIDHVLPMARYGEFLYTSGRSPDFGTSTNSNPHEELIVDQSLRPGDEGQQQHPEGSSDLVDHSPSPTATQTDDLTGPAPLSFFPSYSVIPGVPNTFSPKTDLEDSRNAVPLLPCMPYHLSNLQHLSPYLYPYPFLPSAPFAPSSYENFPYPGLIIGNESSFDGTTVDPGRPLNPLKDHQSLPFPPLDHSMFGQTSFLTSSAMEGKAEHSVGPNRTINSLPNTRETPYSRQALAPQVASVQSNQRKDHEHDFELVKERGHDLCQWILPTNPPSLCNHDFMSGSPKQARKHLMNHHRESMRGQRGPCMWDGCTQVFNPKYFWRHANMHLKTKILCLRCGHIMSRKDEEKRHREHGCPANRRRNETQIPAVVAENMVKYEKWK
ncbi:hypothetical protein GYMLUDRAFT_62084 [Collybiopsis luxurians FD-317 M1]|uniref:Uncharacterized protein n=1 Tax=Collybiopsis luxurians FD-317 M1 TaxID=944289 RepID=A0A0D0CDS9_9AGAR|nr:hypothetical protein GYMLUDRAFT_62084 [Collybiopsis luxurians FD-317 M1]